MAKSGRYHLESWNRNLVCSASFIGESVLCDFARIEQRGMFYSYWFLTVLLNQNLWSFVKWNVTSAAAEIDPHLSRSLIVSVVIVNSGYQEMACFFYFYPAAHILSACFLLVLLWGLLTKDFCFPMPVFSIYFSFCLCRLTQ